MSERITVTLPHPIKIAFTVYADYWGNDKEHIEYATTELEVEIKIFSRMPRNLAENRDPDTDREDTSTEINLRHGGRLLLPYVLEEILRQKRTLYELVQDNGR